MAWTTWILVAGGVLPLAEAWRALGKTSLRSAVLWSALAYGSWAAVWLMLDTTAAAETETARRIALVFSCTPGIAVMGARRPHVGAWNFVVVGLLGVLSLPLVEEIFLGVRSHGELRTFFVAGILGVTCLNYLPTSQALTALLAAGGLVGQFLTPAASDPDAFPPLRPFFTGNAFDLMLLLVPWAAWVTATIAGKRGSNTAFDARWLRFRNAYGLVWGYRVREQFDAAARNAGQPVRLTWHGLVSEGKSPTDPGDIQEMEMVLQALLRRFLEQQPGSTGPPKG